MVAGFLVRHLKDKHPCPEAYKSFQGNPADYMNKLISLHDRGGLLYPSKLLLTLLILFLTFCNFRVIINSGLHLHSPGK